MSKHLAPPDEREPVRGALWRRVALIVLLLVAGTGVGLALYVKLAHKNPVTQFTQIFVPSPAQVFGKPNLLVLVEGLDYDYTPSDQEYSTNSRSDVIWAVNLDFTNRRIYQLSIPRDMIATMPNGTQAKINQAQSDGGVNEAKQVIAKWLGIPGFDKYVILRIDATKEFISAIGGVEVVVKTSDCLRYKTGCTGQTLDYDDTWGHLHIHLKEGLQHLSGEQAVAYMRFRHDWCSDPCRIMRQQQVLRAMAAKVKGDRVNTLLHLPQLLSVFQRYVQTDFTNSELLALASYYQGISETDIANAQVPYTDDIDLPGYGDSLVPDTAERARLVAKMLVPQPSAPPSPDAIALAAIPPSTIRVDVENGSGLPGAAHRIADDLRRAGFSVGTVGDADRSDYATTEIHEHTTVTYAGARVRAAMPPTLHELAVVPDPAPSGTPAAGPSPKSDVTVIVGTDLAKAPAAPLHT